MSRSEDMLRDYLDDLRRRRAGDDDLALLDAQIMAAQDPMGRIRLVERRRAAAAIRRELEDAFVRYARGWAADANVLRAAFLAEGVPPELLDRAGLGE